MHMTPVRVWIALIFLTILSIIMVEGGLLGKFTSVVIIVLAAIKVRLVILYYMEAIEAPRNWRFLYETWNFSVAATIIIGYLII